MKLTENSDALWSARYVRTALKRFFVESSGYRLGDQTYLFILDYCLHPTRAHRLPQHITCYQELVSCCLHPYVVMFIRHRLRTSVGCGSVASRYSLVQITPVFCCKPIKHHPLGRITSR